MSHAEVVASAREMKPILEHEFVKLVDVEGNLVCFELPLPGMNLLTGHDCGSLRPLGGLKILYDSRFIRAIRAIALGVVLRLGTGGEAVNFCARFFYAALRREMQRFELSWVSEGYNLMNRALVTMGVARYITSRIYEGN